MKKLYLLSLVLFTATYLHSQNVGIGNVSPAEKLDVTGNVKSSGIVYWGNGLVRSETRDDAGLIGSSGARSGFFETSNPVNFPSNATSWWHLLDVRHSNNSNNYALQLAGSFFDQNLWFRKTNNNATEAWTRVISANDVNGATNYVSKFTSPNSIGNSLLYDNGTSVGIGTTSPVGNFQIAGSHGNGVYADGNDRPSIGLTGNYPQLTMMSGVANASHGSTIMLGGFDSGNSGVHKHWSLGTAGNNANFLDIGFHQGIDLNPHAGIRNYNGTTVMSLTTDSRVGIGTLAPLQRLHVAGTTQINDNLLVSTNNVTGGGIFLADDGSIVDNNDGYATMRFSLGVAVTDGNNTNTHRIRLRNDGNIEMIGAAPTMNFADTDENDYYIHNNSDRLYFLHGDGYNGWNTERPLTLFQGNKVGINEISPSKRFQVNGAGLTSMLLQQNGNHSHGMVAGIETLNNGAGTQDGPRVGYHKHGAKVWASGIEPGGNNGFAIWEDGYEGSWGNLRFIISTGTTRSSFYRGRTDGNWSASDLSLERSGDNTYFPSISFHNPGFSAPQWFGAYSPQRLNAGADASGGWVNVAAAGFTTISDINMKKNIVDLNENDFAVSLNAIRNIRSIKYNYNNELATEPEPYSGMVKREKPHIGFTAQSLPNEVVVDDLTKSAATHSEGYIKGYSLGDMDGLLVSGVKALDINQQQQGQELQTLKKIVEKQQQEIELLKKMLLTENKEKK